MNIAEVSETLAADWLKVKGEPPAWIWKLHQEWCAERDKNPDRYACRYVDEIKDWIAAKIPFELTEAQRRNLGGYVYTCNNWEDRLNKQKERDAMTAAGWVPLSVEFVKEAAEKGKRVKVVRRGYNLLLQEVEKSEVMRPYIGKKGDREIVALMPARARSRGYDVSRCLAGGDCRWFLQLA